VLQTFAQNINMLGAKTFFQKVNVGSAKTFVQNINMLGAKTFALKVNIDSALNLS
jgi:hypothetical protein